MIGELQKRMAADKGVFKAVIKIAHHLYILKTKIMCMPVSPADRPALYTREPQ